MWRAFVDFCFKHPTQEQWVLFILCEILVNECIAPMTHMIIDCLTTLSKFLFYMHKQSAQKIHQETKHL